MFEQTFLDRPGSARRPWPVAFSFAAQAAFTGVIVVIPLLQTAQLAWKPTAAIVFAPPKPVPPPVAVQRSAVAQTSPGQMLRPVFKPVFTVPSRIPTKIITTADAGPVPEFLVTGAAGSASSASFGLPAVGVIERPAPPVKPAATAAKVSAIRVGTGVQAAKLLAQPKPLYPPLARAARISGVVRLQAVIGRDGTIRNLQLLNGPPLLVNAAIGAVRQWTYQPTLLNGEPVEVLTEIEVNFTLTP